MLSLGIFRDMSHSHKSVFCGSDCSYLGPYLTAIYTFAARACVDIGWGSLLPSTSTASHWGPWLGWLLSGTKDFPSFLEPHHQQTVCWRNSLPLSHSLSQSLVLAAFLVWWLQCKKRSPPLPHTPPFWILVFATSVFLFWYCFDLSLSLSARAGCKKTSSLLHYPRKIKFIHSFSLSLSLCLCLSLCICVCLSLSLALPRLLAFDGNILPSTRLENNIAHPKADKCPSSTSHFSPFNCCFAA